VTRPATPTIRRRELAARLRELRKSAGLTIEDVASQLMISSTKVSRLETASRPAALRDVRDLANLYGVSVEEREHLMTLAKQSKEQSWWQQIGLPENLTTYADLEAVAVSISHYSTSLVPGLLQTSAYAAASISGTLPDVDPELLARLIEARHTRHGLLTSDRPPDLDVVLDEAALVRQVGGAEVMRRQLAALVEHSRLPTVSIRVIPLEAGAHPGMDSSFTVLHLEEVSDLVYVEGLLGNFYLQGSSDIARYRKAFDRLSALALDIQASRQKIAALASDIAT
jgi:transcriptional regulator with XRE-family HTH domain